MVVRRFPEATRPTLTVTLTQRCPGAQGIGLGTLFHEAHMAAQTGVSAGWAVPERAPHLLGTASQYPSDRSWGSCVGHVLGGGSSCGAAFLGAQPGPGIWPLSQSALGRWPGR